MNTAPRRALRTLWLAVALVAAAPTVAAAASGLEAYDVPASSAALSALREQGFDTTEGVVDGRAEVVATPGQVAALGKLGLRPTLKRDARGDTARRAGKRGVEADGSYDVYRPFFDTTYVGKDARGAPRQTIYEEMIALAKAHPDFIEAVRFGTSLNGKPLLALRMTKDAASTPRGSRPAVMYQAAQHAREWITPEMIRRFAQQTASKYGTDEQVTRLLGSRELWFAPVLNPDGYDFTFTPGNRLWRKNLREVNGIPGTQDGDGVDLNRNFPTNWGRDDEGSSPDPASETYRGTGPASEPETQAIDALYREIGFVSVVNWHSAAELLLYPFGYQVQTPSVDDAVYRALSGTDNEPAIAGVPGSGAPDSYDPDLSAELYTTNGDTIDHADTTYGTFTWTPEMDVGDEDRGGGASVFEFQDSGGDLQDAFLKNVPFALDLAESAADMSEPTSHLGTSVPDFEPHVFDVSHGTPQTVAVTAKRKLGDVVVAFRVNGGPEQTAPTTEVATGERSGGEVLHEVRGAVTGTEAGDRVEVAFVAGEERSTPFTYEVAKATGAQVLLLEAENYTGASAFPAITKTDGPSYAKPYEDALTAAGISYDTFDVDAAKQAPDQLGVLSHYQAVVWYTGDDLLARSPGQGAGTGVSKLSNDTTLNVRSYLHEGGKLLYSGQHAGFAASQGVYGFNPVGEPPYCDSEDPVSDYSATFNRCVLVSDDFLQYDLGAFQTQVAAGATAAETPEDEAAAKAAVSDAQLKLADAEGGTAFELNGGTSADNQRKLSTAITTSSILRPDAFPQFASRPFAAFEGPAAYSPATGEGYVVTQEDSDGWRRLKRTVDLAGAESGALRFKISRDTEPDYDYVFVEAHTVGQDDWTTLPDANGHTSQDTGSSCSEVNWNATSPFVNRYQTRVSAERCDPQGTTGEWNAATGSSGGYENWSIDLSAYAGKQVEVSISYLQDPSVSGLGVFLDDAEVVVGDETVATAGFEDGLDGFAAGPAPEGSVESTQAQFRQTGDIGLSAAPAIATADTVYLQFGLEGIREADQRQAVMGAALRALAVAPPTPAAPQPPAAVTPAPGPRPAPARTRTPKARIALGAFRLSRTGRATVRVVCPKTSESLRCAGTVTLSRLGRRIGRVSYSVGSGRTATARVRITAAARRTVARTAGRGAAVRVTVTNRSGALRSTTTTRSARLKAARR